jgi:succinate dehydrogenase / fumarate reductase cytochrome b subunit
MSLTSILKKVAMAFTGLGLFVFLVLHLSGNLLIYKGAAPFNAYAENLRALGVLLYIAEAGLVLFFLVHIYSGIRVSLENRKARPERYEKYGKQPGGGTFASRTMAIGGIIIAVFLVIHLKMFKYGDDSGAGGLWGLVIRSFHDPLISAFYVIAMLALGLHLSHGFSSAFQTLGAIKPGWRAGFKKTGFALGWIIALGFASFPVYVFLAKDL